MFGEIRQTSSALEETINAAQDSVATIQSFERDGTAFWNEFDLDELLRALTELHSSLHAAVDFAKSTNETIQQFDERSQDFWSEFDSSEPHVRA